MIKIYFMNVSKIYTTFIKINAEFKNGRLFVVLVIVMPILDQWA